MCYFVAQQTSSAKLPAFFQRFWTKVQAVKVNEANVTTEKIFSRDNFETENNYESNDDEIPCLRYLTVKDRVFRALASF